MRPPAKVHYVRSQLRKRERRLNNELEITHAHDGAGLRRLDRSERVLSQERGSLFDGAS
jgi:hypothetical protein